MAQKIVLLSTFHAHGSIVSTSKHGAFISIMFDCLNTHIHILVGGTFGNKPQAAHTSNYKFFKSKQLNLLKTWYRCSGPSKEPTLCYARF